MNLRLVCTFSFAAVFGCLNMGCGGDGSGADLECLAMDNPGFEQLALDDVEFTVSKDASGFCGVNPFCVPVIDPIPGWDFGPSDGFIGTFDPTTAFFTGDAPEGENVGFIGPQVDESPFIRQVLVDTLQPNTEYVLTVQVGERLDGVLFPDYTVELRADDVLLAEDPFSFMPGAGNFILSTVTFETGDVHPQLDEPLEVRITASLPPADAQAFFDDVCLTAEAL